MHNNKSQMIEIILRRINASLIKQLVIFLIKLCNIQPHTFEMYFRS